MSYRKSLMLSLMLMTGMFTGCITKYRPLQEYRSSKAYRQNLNRSFPSESIIYVDTVFFASGLMRKTKLDRRIPIKLDELSEVVIKRLKGFGSLPISVHDSVKTVTVDKFAFNHPFGKKLDFEQFNAYSNEGCRLIPYAEMGIFKGVETEGGGGIESITYTGNRIHNITQGVVLAMFCDGDQVFSSGHYITNLYINHKDSVTVYDFPVERLDSLMALCLTDLEKEIEAYKDRLK